MSKIFDSTQTIDAYHLLTQTPKNQDKRHYFRKELQDKLNYDWDTHLNRVDIEEEQTFGSDNYEPIEVIIQTVKSEKGKEVSDDWRNLVFRDISRRTKVGTRFRFSYNFDLNEDDKDKSIWIASNQNAISATSGVVAVRCNGTIGSVYTDERGIEHLHYEPVIQTKELKTVNLFYNTTMVTAQGELSIIAQHNQYTRNYRINDRFIIGYDTVYRVKALNKFNSLTTYDPEDVGTIMLYLEITEKSDEDNFQTRIAYNGNKGVDVIENQTDEKSIKLLSPTALPDELLSDAIIFNPALYIGGVVSNAVLQIAIEIQGVSDPSTYVELVELTNLGDNFFSLKRKRFYGGNPLKVTFYSTEHPNVSYSFEMSLKGLE